MRAHRACAMASDICLVYTSTGGRGTGADRYVIRGAAFNSYARIATAWFRTGLPSIADRKDLDKTGFRCAMPARSGADGSGG